MIYEAFEHTLARFSQDTGVKAALWDELATRYAEPHRHYHNLRHLEALTAELHRVRDRIEDWDAGSRAGRYIAG